MGNIRRGGQCEGGKCSSEELLGHDQQMGGQGEKGQADSWRDKAEILCVCVGGCRVLGTES